MIIRLCEIKIFKVSSRIRQLESVNEPYTLQCIIITSLASPKRHLKTAGLGLYEIALFLIMSFLTHDHQTVVLYEI